MEQLTGKIKKLLSDSGADIVGIGELRMIECNSRKNMPYGICVAVAIPTEVIEGISKVPTDDYFNTYHKLNKKLDVAIQLEKYRKSQLKKR